MPPVGAYVSALSVISERRIASVYGPSGRVARPDHSRQNSTVSRSASSAFTFAGGLAWLGDQVSTNGTRSPALTVNSDSVVHSCPCSGAVLFSHTASGPATASNREPRCRTHGVIRP